MLRECSLKKKKEKKKKEFIMSDAGMKFLSRFFLPPCVEYDRERNDK